MEEKITIDTLEIDGKNFILIDNVENYYFFFEENNEDNICVLKEIVENEEELLVSLENDNEIDKAFDLLEEKYKNSQN